MDHKQWETSSGVTSQLQQESRRMEERMQALKEMMRAEKLKREATGGLHWQSGQKGPLLRKGNQLQNGSSSNMKRMAKRPLRVQVLRDSAPPHSQMPQCGQCEESTASLSCMECVENYCKTCFIKFHQKGALAKHHVMPMTVKAQPLSKTHTTQQTSEPNVLPTNNSATSHSSNATYNHTRSFQQVNQHGVDTHRPRDAFAATASHQPHKHAGSLLEGTYDEGASAALFQEALLEWRATGRREEGENTTTQEESSSQTKTFSSTQTTPPADSTLTGHPDPHSIEVRFSTKAGVSYLERLIMRRYRIDPSFLNEEHQRNEVHAALEQGSDCEETLGNEDALECTPSEYNVFYSRDKEAAAYSEMDYDSAKASCDPQHDHFKNPSIMPTSSVIVEELPLSRELPNVKHTMEGLESESDQNVYSQPPSDSVKLYKKGFESRPKQCIHSLLSLKPSGQKTALPQRKAKPTKVSSKTQSLSSNLTTSKDSRHAIFTSVRNAWGEIRPHKCTSDSLSEFFLSGVNHPGGTLESPSTESETVGHPNATSRSLQFTSAVWLPANSIAESTNLSEIPTCANGSNSDISDSHTIDVHTDLPPSANLSDLSPPGEMQDADYNSDSSSHCSELEDIAVCELGEEVWQQKELEQGDSATLESLAWELASATVGWLTRAEDEEDSKTVPSSLHCIDCVGTEQKMLHSNIGTEQNTHFNSGNAADMERIQSEFETYWQQLIEEDSDQ